MKHNTLILLRIIATVTMILLSQAASAQMFVVRPAKVDDRPKIAPVNISQATAQLTEAKAKAVTRKRATTRTVRRPKNTAAVTSPTLPPVEFTSSDNAGDNTPRLNPSLFMAERPESRGTKIESSATHSLSVGKMEVRLPQCIEIFESGPDFFTGAMDNLIEIDTWMLDPTYKLSTPQAYIKYINELYGGIESTETSGNRTVISGYDTTSSRNYHVAMVTDGNQFYVTRIIYQPAIERQVSQSIKPGLLVPSEANTAL